MDDKKETNYTLSDADYERFQNREYKVYNQRLRDENQSFDDFMQAGHILEGVEKEKADAILEIIKTAGKMNV